MKTIAGMILSAVGGLLLCGVASAADLPAQRDPLYQTMNQGNSKDAYDGLRKIILEPGQPDRGRPESGGAMPGRT